MTDDYSDRRSFARIPKETSIAVSKLEYPPTAHGSSQATLINISQDGICCTVPTDYPVGTILNLKITLKGWMQHRKGVRNIVDVKAAKAPLTVIGEVMWCKSVANADHEIGVRLTNVYEDDQKALNDYLQSLKASR